MSPDPRSDQIPRSTRHACASTANCTGWRRRARGARSSRSSGRSCATPNPGWCGPRSAVPCPHWSRGPHGWEHVSRRFPTAPALSPVFVLMGLAPWLWQVAVRFAGYDGSPLEVVLISSVLCLVCGLAAAGCWSEFQPLAMLGSLFVVMFSATLWNGALPRAGVAGFALCGLAWLAVGHWASLSARMKDRRRPAPRGTLLLPVVLAGCLLGGLALGGANRIWSLAGWMPSFGWRRCLRSRGDVGGGKRRRARFRARQHPELRPHRGRPLSLQRSTQPLRRLQRTLRRTHHPQKHGPSGRPLPANSAAFPRNA